MLSCCLFLSSSFSSSHFSWYYVRVKKAHRPEPFKSYLERKFYKTYNIQRKPYKIPFSFDRLTNDSKVFIFTDWSFLHNIQVKLLKTSLHYLMFKAMSQVIIQHSVKNSLCTRKASWGFSAGWLPNIQHSTRVRTRRVRGEIETSI